MNMPAMRFMKPWPTPYLFLSALLLVVTSAFAQSPPLPLAEYRMDEGGWSGVAGQVIDSSGNGYNAQAVNSANTTSAIPAISGNPGTCRYGVFDNGGTITQGYVQTPLPNLTTDFTVTSWIRTTDNTIAGQRILIDDQGTAPGTGYGLSLGDGASGILRFYSRGITPISLDSTYAIANNTWYFVAAVADITNKKRTIHVFNAAGTLLNSTTEAAWTGTWGTDGGPVSIGGETNASAESPASFHFHGYLDEVSVYMGALTAAQLAAIRNKTRACQLSVDHVAISAPTTSMALTATLVPIAPHDAAHALMSNGSTISLSTSTGNGDWTIGGGGGTLTRGAADSGLAIYTFGPGETSVTLGFTYQTAGTVSIYVADAGAIDLLLNTPVTEKANTIIFSMPSFVFTNSVCVDGKAFGATGQTCTPITWSPQVAGQSLTNVYITAVNTSGVPTRLSTSARTRSMQFGLSCRNPVANAGKQAVFAASTLLLCAPNGAKPSNWSPTITASFPGSVPSAGPYGFNYADVGMVELWMRDSGTTTNVGSSGSFVVKPGGFVISGIKCTTANAANCGAGAGPTGNNPAASTTAGLSFIPAGLPFTAIVTATTCSLASATCTVVGKTTPNYGKETVPESVKLTPNNAIAGMVAAPAIGGTFGAFTLGVATGTAFTWGEVGIITLTPSVIDGSYLGAGDTSGTTSGNVGRFIPDHFNTVVNQVANVPMACPDSSCPTTYNGFVYSGQPFSLTVTAKNASDDTTGNYNTTTGFAKSTALSAFGVLGATTAATGAGTLGVASVTAFADGTLTEPAEKYTFTTIPTAPTNIYIRASDGETSSLRASNPTTTSVEGGVKVVSGRIKVSNEYGSEFLQLPFSVTAQYWKNATSGWVTSSTDGASSFVVATPPATSAMSFGNYQKNLTTVSIVGSPKTVTFSSGVGGFTLSAPGTGKNGSVDMSIPAVTGVGCNVSPTPLGCYLPSNTGRATFGIYKSPLIYRRENY